LLRLQYLDEYDFRARLVPSIFVTLPAIFAVLALLPSWRGFLVAPAIEVALVLVLVRIARDEGKKLEPQVVREWDGPPTTRYLRHRTDEIEQPLRDRYRAAISKATGINLPDAAAEAANPAGADALYASAIAVFRDQRRDKKKYPLIFAENCNYGMMRNLLGLRSTGLAMAAVCAIVGSAALLTSYELAVLTLVVAAVVALILVRFVTKAAVKRTAEAYAVALLRTSLLSTASNRKKK
jgi:hypothetical protein